MPDDRGLQRRFAPHNRCFGCGPANDKGLQLDSVPDDADPRTLIATWTPAGHHEAFEGVLNGGIVGALLDCHANWAASWWIMQEDGLDKPPCTVTAEFTVKMRRPTPTDAPLRLRARAVERDGNKVTVDAELGTEEKVTATCRGLFVAVGPGHPAYGRW